MRPLYFITLSMMLLARIVNGAEPGVKPSTGTATFETTIRRIIAQGKAEKFEGLTRFARVPKASPTREEWAYSKMSKDRHRRYFAVILGQSTETLKATHVELFVGQKDKPARKEKGLYFLISPEGDLLESGFAFGPLDEKGKVIPGPALTWFENLDIKAPGTRALFEREMDFWVKGIGRKISHPEKAASKNGD